MPVFAPRSEPRSKKRKATSSRRSQKRSKRHHSVESSDEGPVNSDYENDNTSSSQGSRTGDSPKPQQVLLTEEYVTKKIGQLRSEKRELRAQKLELNERIIATRKELTTAEDAESRIEDTVAARCIAGRNNYSKGYVFWKLLLS